MGKSKGDGKDKLSMKEKRSLNIQKKIEKKKLLQDKISSFEQKLAKEVKVRQDADDEMKGIEKKAPVANDRAKKAKPLFSFEDLQSILPDAMKPLAQFSADHTGKPINVNSIVESETEQMKAVIQHPSFSSSPLTTIHEHLLNSIKSHRASHLTFEEAKTNVARAERGKVEQPAKPVKKKAPAKEAPATKSKGKKSAARRFK